MKSANEFYGECLEGFITVVRGFGYANGGALGNEVLTRRAEQSVRELLKIKPMIKVFGNDPVTYYYEVNGLAFAMGVVLAMLQANAPQKFTERNLVQMIAGDPETSPHELAFHTMQQFGMDIGIYNMIVQDLYKKFQELHEPYWSAKEPRDYTLAAFYASFMTGCSVAIDKFNERRAQKLAAPAAPAPTAEKKSPAEKKAVKKTAPRTKKTADKAAKPSPRKTKKKPAES